VKNCKFYEYNLFAHKLQIWCNNDITTKLVSGCCLFTCKCRSWCLHLPCFGICSANTACNNMLLNKQAKFGIKNIPVFVLGYFSCSLFWSRMTKYCVAAADWVSASGRMMLMKEKQQREEVEKQRRELEERLRQYEEDFETAKRGLYWVLWRYCSVVSTTVVQQTPSGHLWDFWDTSREWYWFIDVLTSRQRYKIFTAEC